MMLLYVLYLWISIILCICSSINTISLPSDLNIDKSNILIAGYNNSASFSHQFHISYSSIISGSCIISGQPFHCAVEKFHQDTLTEQNSNSRVPYCDGCPPGTTLPFNHCKITPNVVDVGSLVDYPRRHCGQNPIRIHECIDDVYYFKNSKVFISRNSKYDIFGAVENTVGLISQMIYDPQNSIKYVIDSSDEQRDCVQHIYNAPWMKPGKSIQSSWYKFNQTQFFENELIGFQDKGWIYIPQRCEKGNGDQICKLIIRPDKCSPDNNEFAHDIAEYANYAEINAMIILHPCVGGKVNTTKYPNSFDIQNGKLDIYGQLSNNYVEQSAPHMSTIANMVRKLLNIQTNVAMNTKTNVINNKQQKEAIKSKIKYGLYPTLPTLPSIDKNYIMTAGCSNTADFAHQFHVSFSSIVTGSCIFSGMPFRCAVTRFVDDYMVPKTPSTAAGIHCDGCDSNGTLIYDHCKNHPHLVDIDVLMNYAENNENVDNPKEYLLNDRTFVFGPTHDRCYQPPSMENVANFYLKYAQNSSQVLLIENEPFPHTLPTNTTPYFNDNLNFTGAGYDGPGECLKHVFGNGHQLYASSKVDPLWWKRMNVSQFVVDKGIGLHSSAWLFLPPQCDVNSTNICKLLILPGGCDAEIDPLPPAGGSDEAFAKYATLNNIVILKPCGGKLINQTRFPQNHENLRGLCDVYGQLNANYATKIGDQMAPIANMMKKLIGKI